MTTNQLYNQITVLIVSMLFSIEFVLFAVKRVENGHIARQRKAQRSTVFTSIRQIAFLFYFAFRLSSSFITILAKSLPSSFTGLDANVAAGLPQTVDTFFTCVALLFTFRVLNRRGWRPPFVLGLVLVTAGTLASAFTPTLLWFILARSLVGLGYGFCWMTLRSMTLLGEDAQARSWGFSMLNAGIYAGMICGSTIGSILANSLGYSTVLMLSAGLLVLCSISVFTMENQFMQTHEKQDTTLKTPKANKSSAWKLLAFMLLMVAPTCIIASVPTYYLPLFYQNIGHGVLEVGRAQLLNGMLIVYVGPFISSRIARRSGSLLSANCAYNLILVTGLILLGLTGNLFASYATVACIGLGNSFGFGVQNTYMLAQPFVRRIGESRALSYISLGKKLLEMAGPTVLALTLSGASTRSILLLGIMFAAAACLFFIIDRILPGKEAHI